MSVISGSERLAFEVAVEGSSRPQHKFCWNSVAQSNSRSGWCVVLQWTTLWILRYFCSGSRRLLFLYILYSCTCSQARPTFRILVRDLLACRIWDTWIPFNLARNTIRKTSVIATARSHGVGAFLVPPHSCISPESSLLLKYQSQSC